MPVLVEARFGIAILAWVTEIQRKGFTVSARIFVRFAIAEGVRYPVPYDGAVRL